jgi:hypothetical protein
MSKVFFKDLSTSLKVLVVFGWVALVVWVTFFFIGFILGVTESV